MQLINSTVIRELSTIIFFPGAKTRGLYPGGLYPGLINAGLISRAYLRGLYAGLYPGALIFRGLEVNTDNF